MADPSVEIAAGLFEAEIRRLAPGTLVTLFDRSHVVIVEIIAPQGSKHGGRWREVWGVSKYGVIPSEMSPSSPSKPLERALKRATKVAKQTLGL